MIKVAAFTDAAKAFEGCDVIVFLGGFPRKPGM
jgi:malate/lactate dehydrogenase